MNKPHSHIIKSWFIFNMETQTEEQIQGFKFNYSNKERVIKKLQEDKNIKQSKEVLNSLGIQVY